MTNPCWGELICPEPDKTDTNERVNIVKNIVCALQYIGLILSLCNDCDKPRRMTDQKLFAGAAVRRIRRANGLTQTAMAEALAVSASYLNLIERNQRPMTAAILLRLAERFDFDARSLTGATPGGGVEALKRRLSDPLFADLNLDRLQLEDWIAAAPDAAEAFARAFDRLSGGGGVAQEADAIAAVRTEIERWRNHFADLDAQAGSLADELRLASAENAEPLRVADTKSDERFNADVDAVTGYETRSVLCVPLMIKKGVIGVIELLNKRKGFYSEKDKELITYLSDQAAISLTRARFYEDQKNYQIHITDILLEAIDVQIPEKLGHSKRVAKYSNIIAKAINMSEEKMKRLYFACLLHDVGFLKIMADENYQRENFRKHPAIGYEMISPINFYADIALFILHHHERYDGFGYPEGLKADEIPLESRIIAIAEAFDAMVSETSYKVPLDFDSAVLELQRNAGSQFDFWLVEVFVNNITYLYSTINRLVFHFL